MDIKVLLGKRIQEIRRSKNITQEYLAELIDVDTVSISNIERGKYYPSADNLNKILINLETTPSELFKFEHLASSDELINEMVEYIKDKPELTKIIYKFFNSVKNDIK